MQIKYKEEINHLKEAHVMDCSQFTDVLKENDREYSRKFSQESKMIVMKLKEQMDEMKLSKNMQIKEMKREFDV